MTGWCYLQLVSRTITMDANDDLYLSIPLDPIKDFFSCPVCMCLYNMTVMTPCGHRYCEGCIIEWIDRKRKCPCCNAPVRIGDLIRDTGFDGLINIITKEKSKAEDAYFSDLITKCAATGDAAGTMSNGVTSNGEIQNGAGSVETDQKSVDKLSPVEEVLRKHIRFGVVEHERYYRVLKSQFHRELESAEKKIGELQEEDEEERQLWLKKKDCLTVEFERCTKLLTNAYDKYLSDHLPSLSTLPVTVYIRLYGKSLVIGSVVLQPHFSMADIKQALCMRIREKQDRVAVYRDENVHYLLVRPFAVGHVVVDEELVATLLSKPDPYECDESDLLGLLPRHCIPVLEYAVQPGSHIIVFGDIKLRSELPKPCFAVLFNEGEEKMDYFTCKDCSFNWVCRSCKEHCHKGHVTVPYVMGHQPTWACCYCPRKNKCLLREPGN